MADARLMAPPWLHAQGGDVLIDVIVVPRSSRTRIVDVFDNRLKIQLTAAPVDGKANAALVEFLAGALGVSKAQVEVVGGASNRRKTVRLAGVSVQRVLLALTPAAARS